MKKRLIMATALLVAATSANAKTYAKVYGEKITEKNIEAVLSANPNAPEIDKIPAETINKIVKQIVERKVLAKHAIKAGIKNEKVYKEKLAQVEEALATDLWMKIELGKIKVTPKEVRSFYDRNIDKFREPAQVKAKHILVKTEKEAKDLIKTLNRTSGERLEEKFISLAKEKSIGPSGKKGGDLGWFTKERMVKPFADASFKMRVGTFSKKAVKTQFGWHVIYVEDKKKEKTIPYETIAGRLEDAAKAEKFKKKLDATLGNLVKRANVKYYTK